MKEFSWYVGIDVSKNWLDIAVITGNAELLSTARINNDALSINEHVSSLGIDLGQTLFCLENTGKYGNAFLEVTAQLQMHTWVEHPLQIKRSQGIVRGKTDKDDAVRIAQYAYRFKDNATLWKPEEKVILQLKELQTKRDLLVKSKRQLNQVLEGKRDTVMLSPIKAIQDAIDKIEDMMLKVVQSDAKLSQQYKLLQSIPGIGKVVGVSLLITTRGFSKLTDPRKLACYIGIAPFPYQSGSSINYRNRISKIGDQRLKALLNLSALNAIRAVPALKNYYERKVQQGKHKLSVINAIRNKMVAITLSVIKREQPFTKEYSFA